MGLHTKIHITTINSAKTGKIQAPILYVVNYAHFPKIVKGGFQIVKPCLQKNAGALWLDKARPRGIMKIQKGAVDLTVGPIRSKKMLTARGTAGRSTSF